MFVGNHNVVTFSITLLGLLLWDIPPAAASDLRTNKNVSAASIFQLSLEQLSDIPVSIATGTDNTLKSAPAITSVITAEAIKNLGARTLDEVLETVPGLHVSLSRINRLDAVYSLRGIHTGLNPHVLLLLNGNPVQWALQGGRPFLYRLPANMVSRIEIIRGPGSAIYGSDAFSGVINVITKSTEDIEQTEIAARVGSFSTRDFWLNVGKRLGEWNMALNFSYLDTEGDSGRIINHDLQTTLDAMLGTNASLAPGALQTDYTIVDTHINAGNIAWDINLWHWASINTGNGAGGLQAIDPVSKEDFRSYFFDTRYQPEEPLYGWNHVLKFTYFNHRVKSNLTLLPADTLAPIGSDGNINFIAPAGLTLFTEGIIGRPGGLTQDTFFEWVTHKQVFDKHQLRFSAGYRDQTLDTHEEKNFGPGILDGSETVVDGTLTDVSDTNYVFLNNTQRSIAHIALQDEWKISEAVTLTGGVRYDDYSDFGSTTNPRLALVWNTSEKLTTKFLYGNAFRAPSFSELRYQNNPAVIGNPNLKPETIDTFEISLDYRPWSTLQTTLNLFYYNARQMIAFVPGLDGSVAENARDQNGKGMEMELKWFPSPKLNITLNSAWQNSYDAETREKTADAPALQGMIILNWEFYENWLFNINSNWVAGRERFVFDYRDGITDNHTLDLHLMRRQLMTGLDISLKVKNVFDSDVREPSNGFIPDDYPLEGRSFWLQSVYTFQ